MRGHHWAQLLVIGMWHVCTGSLADVDRMYEVVIYQVLLGAVLGVLIGFAARKSLRWAHDRQ
jgi:NhaP-type Na+/H+ or K+/H+ antiporter